MYDPRNSLPMQGLCGLVLELLDLIAEEQCLLVVELADRALHELRELVDLLRFAPYPDDGDGIVLITPIRAAMVTVPVPVAVPGHRQVERSDRFLDGSRGDAAFQVVGDLLRAAAGGLVDRSLDRPGGLVGVEDDVAVHVARCTP